MKRAMIACFALTGATLPASAQASDDVQLWTGASATVKLGDNWRLSEDVVSRFGNQAEGLYEIEINTLLGYRLRKGVTVWAGYTHDPTYARRRPTIMEHRGREQITFDNVLKIGPVNVSGRLRTEQRWREGFEGTAWRVRPFIKFTLPLTHESGFKLVASHESFIDLNRTNFQRVEGEERMRNLIAVSAPISKAMTLEVGYLHQLAFAPDAPNEVDHVASVMLSSEF